jgi:hypothetical protein
METINKIKSEIHLIQGIYLCQQIVTHIQFYGHETKMLPD